MTALIGYAFCIPLFFLSWSGFEIVEYVAFTAISKDKIASSSLRCPNIPKVHEVYQCVSSVWSLVGGHLMSLRSLEDALQCISILSSAQKSFVVTILQLKRRRWGFLFCLVNGELPDGWQIFSFTTEHNILLSCFFLPSQSGVYVWSRTQQ